MGEHPYRPLPTPPRLRWAVVRVARKPKPVVLAVGFVGGMALSAPIHHRVPWWALLLALAVSALLWGRRLVRVPVTEPPTRWALVPRRWFKQGLCATAGAALACGVASRGIGLGYVLLGVLASLVLLCLAGLRFVRVPIASPQVRAAEELTTRERFNLVDAGGPPAGDEWDLDTQRRIDALMRARLVKVEAVEMPGAREKDRRG